MSFPNGPGPTIAVGCSRRLVPTPEPDPGYTTPAAFEAEWHETNKRATLSFAESPAGDPGDANHPSEPVAQAATTQTNEPL